jgi:predicted Ser/Thr protein kinase
LITLKDLTLHHELGKGAFGVVYVADYQGERCAMKEVRISISFPGNVTLL